MGSGESEIMKKRMKPSVEDDESGLQTTEEETETKALSEQMELDITHILERINNFNQQISELLESGKLIMNELSNKFEEQLLLIHKEQIEKWQEEINELRLLDSSNEEINAVLHNARFILQNVHGDS